ncbi:MAG: LytTR family DNA-binding domain-containing protein [bacterium]|nr:LytTR family DNA-binding domain-containing protein [bacterium]
MNVVIVEDEERAANRLQQLIKAVRPSFEVVAKLETVREAIAYNWDENGVKLVFLDIHLADGSSFEIFKSIQLDIPIIFTTAYDQYALDAFQVNSIDYLLKPIQEESLEEAIIKFEKRLGTNDSESEKLSQLIDLFQNKSQANLKNLLVHHKQKLIPVAVEEFAFFFIENGLVKGRTLKNELYILDQNLDELEQSIDSKIFYRANRQIIIRDKCISSIESYFNSRLLVSIHPAAPFEILISKAKAREFKEWVQG